MGSCAPLDSKTHSKIQDRLKRGRSGRDADRPHPGAARAVSDDRSRSSLRKRSKEPRRRSLVRAHPRRAGGARLSAEHLPRAVRSEARAIVEVLKKAGAFIVEWERIARSLLARLHREWLERPSDGDLSALVQSLCDYPDVPQDWSKPDLSVPSEPCLMIREKARRSRACVPHDGDGLQRAAERHARRAPPRELLPPPLDDATRRACAEGA